MSPESTRPPRRRTRRVSAQHTQERVRNNQRRHRARQREYTATLEQRLDEAEQTISSLRRHVEALEGALTRRRSQTHHQQETDCRMPPSLSSSAEPFLSSNQLGSASPIPIVKPVNLETERLPSAQLSRQNDAEPEIPPPKTVLQSREPMPPTPCSSNHLSTDGQAAVQTANAAITLSQDPPLLLPEYVLQPQLETYYQTRPGSESTMPCADAYILIQEQNFRAMDQGDVAAWLCSGFRRWRRPGEGCRVQTDILFSLLAFISDTSSQVLAKVTP